MAKMIVNESTQRQLDFYYYQEKAIMTDNASSLGFLPDSEPSIIEDIRSSQHSSSSPQISELAHTDNKLQQKVEELNLQGLTLYQNEDFSQALIFFTQCEKILEYAANCGSAIGYSHIITILHNQAATYQALNDTEKASRYVEAIIYNLTTFLSKQENIQMIRELEELFYKPLDRDSTTFVKEKYQLIRLYLSNLFQLAKYYLQFSGITSQNQLHQQSLEQAKKALSTIKQLCLRCFQVQSLQEKSQLGRSLLKDLSEAKIRFNEIDFKTILDQFTKISSVFPDNNQVYHNLYDYLTPQSKLQLQQTNIHSLFDLNAKSLSESVLEYSPTSHHYNIQICSSHFHHIIKILTMMGAYFALAVQLEQIDSINSQLYHTTSQYEYSEVQYNRKENKKEAQMMLLSALNLSYKYIPVETELTQYLLSLYQETYPKQTHTEESTPLTEELKIQSSQPRSNPQKQKEESIIESIVKQYIVDEGEVSTKEHNIMKVSINLLTEKYKDYMVEKDLSFEESPSAECIVKNIENWKQETLKRSMKASMKSSQEYKTSSNWDQEKKESKKLADLFSTDHASNAPNTLLKPNYLNQVASIDSISMANSQSAQQQSIPQKNIPINTGHEIKHQKINPIINKVKTKQIPEGECSLDINRQKDQRQGQKRVHFARPRKMQNKSFRKSKSAKFITSKSKEQKDINHRVVFTQKTIQSVQEGSAINNRSGKRKGKKSPSKKKKNEDMNEINKLLGSDKKNQGLTNINVSKGLSSTRSFKDTSITFNRVKSPPRMVQSSKNSAKLGHESSKTSKMTRYNNIQMLTSINEKPQKSKSRNKTISLGTKKQTKSKSLSSKKSLNKMMKNSQPCIYTSVYTGSKKR